MDFYGKYKSPLGYQTGANQIDSYGVDHSGFTLRDELAYQMARQQRENQIIKNYNNHGITQDYPQSGTNFWGNSPDNNFGFGTSQISSNIENMQNTPVPNVQNQAYGTSSMAGPSSSSSFSNSINPYARIKQLLEQNDYTQNQEVNNINQLTQNSLLNSGSDSTSNNIDYSLYGNDFSKEFINEMLNDKRFQNIMNNRVRINEGGYVNHPNDRGGETKFAISSRWYPNEDIKNLTRERADMILFRDYWKDTNIYQLPDEIADIVLDDSIVQGQPTAIKNLQRALGIVDDGIIGQNTLNSIKNTNIKTLKEKFIKNVKDIEEQYLNNDPSQRVFEKGHKNRFNKY